MLEGIDVSDYQGFVNWEQVHKAGRSFAAAKATEGLGGQQTTFAHNWPGMKRRGFRRIAYHYFHDSYDPVRQVDVFHQWVKLHGHFQHGDAACIDVEEEGITTPGLVVTMLRTMVYKIYHDINVPVIIYTNPDTWINVLGNTKDSVLAECPLWLAVYGGQIPVILNWPDGPSFHQYTDSGECPGVPGEVDLNRFFGSKVQLNKIMDTSPHVHK